MVELLLKGLIIGFAIAAPVGPIGILCINRSLNDGFAAGFICGLGAATADGVYGCVAAFGLTFISSFFINQQIWIHLIGGLFLLYLGYGTIRRRVAEKGAILSSNNNLLKAYYTTFFLTLTNPMTILSFLAIFAGAGIGQIGVDYSDASILVVGVVVGSLLWWMALSYSVSLLLRHRLNTVILQRINYLSGTILIAFGVSAIVSLFYKVAI
jgi:threonine/homoserine/homoserine lactone efflux protein